MYSLGATLYCLLTGRPPFEGDVGDVLRAVQRGEFPPPRKLDPSIDRALEAVCLKAMAMKPEDRYASCHALAEDIERWMADEPVTAWREPFGAAGPAVGAAGTEPRSPAGGRGARGRGGRAVGRAGRGDPGQGRIARSLASETRPTPRWPNPMN